MAGLFRHRPVLAPADSREGGGPPPTSGLHDRPVLTIDPGLHTAMIRRADADAAGRWAVTGSDDKTVRVWSLADGALAHPIRLPSGPGNVGKVFAVALSPDGALVAAGGFTGPPGEAKNIYLFERATGALRHRIDGLPNGVAHLAFSPDGRHLVATLGGADGLRVYGRDMGWAEVALEPEPDYGGDSYGAAFAADGRLATTSLDGMVRLYDGGFRPDRTVAAPGGARPYGVAFSPDGATLAVGYDDTPAVDLLDGRTLAPRGAADTDGVDNGSLSSVAWSADGRTLFAGGRYDRGDGMRPVLAWTDRGQGTRRALEAGRTTVMSLVPLPDGDVLAAATDPLLTRLAPDGGARWTHAAPQADFRAQHDTLAVSADGRTIDFGYIFGGDAPARFDVGALALTSAPGADDRTAPPGRDGPAVTGWKNSAVPKLAGAPLPLERYEMSRSLAVHPGGQRFVLGTEWWLRAFDADGTPLWRRAVPGPAWAVNVSGDGRLVVAAYGDGTIRWHAMDDGRELLAFFPLADRSNWVAWTPEGFYAATPGAHGVLRWHVNRGWDAPADSVRVHEIQGSRRPEVLPLALQELDIVRALGLAELAEQRRQVRLRTGGAVPGARLHVLAIGVSDYGAQAEHLKLRYAHKDAHDVATALRNTQDSLYTVVPQVLPDKEATRSGVFHAFEAMASGMAMGGGNDLAVVFFAGHGALVDGVFYLLPHGAAAGTHAQIRSDGIAMNAVRVELRRLADYGRVLVLLDACRSGGALADGTPFGLDAATLRAALVGANVSVLTACTADEPSRENAAWENGAFTEVFLTALTEADFDKNGLISVADLQQYLSQHVPRLTNGAQRPGVEVRFQSDIFVADL